jgi:oxalate decarboxylase/phosphoglucose isomerase-like protein (cupin superfamily)
MSDYDRLVTHLTAQGVLKESVRPLHPGPVLDDMGGLLLDTKHGLTFGGQRVDATPRRLADLLSAGDARGWHVADRAAAEDLIREGRDPVLYRAVRDVFPARLTATNVIRADLVLYESGTLPGGEPYRSIGHWNPPAQLEIFQILTGQMAILVAGESCGGYRFAYVQVCAAGDTVTVPLGAWHVSYVVDGQAAVFNVYADLDGTADEGQTGKYQRGTSVGITLRRDAGGLRAVATPDARHIWNELTDPPRADWLSEWMLGSDSLADLHLHASERHWETLMKAALEAHAQDWAVQRGLPARILP